VEPAEDPAVKDGRARPLAIPDVEKAVSRVHADIRLVDWDVMIVDRGSANGTFIFPPGAQQWIRVAPDQPAELKPSTHVALGRRTFVFDSHHEREKYK
jgi:pSer/pThr/pTyr-binding forkhead associated (FHA) protein